jgi:hypothetical protein
VPRYPSTRLLSPRWLAGHLLVLLLVAAFLALGWWQVGRARGGNTLSFGYALEWPLFAGFVVYVWVKEIRSDGRRRAAAPPPVEVPADLAGQPGYLPFAVGPARGAGPAGPVATRPDRGADDGDPELVAYNRYLEWLAANPGRRPSEYHRSEG